MDGPSGTGKSTVSKRLAAELRAAYLDTGAMYRAVTLAVLRAGVDPSDGDAVAAVASRVELVSGTDPRRPTIALDGEDVGAEIRGPQVTAAVSAVSAEPRVRRLLVELQRRHIVEALAAPGGMVVEGRDIGTVVAPDAVLKVYLTATAQARAERRNSQNTRSGRPSNLDDTRADVERRDAFDSSRAASPLRAADDAITVDTTRLDVAGVLRALHDLVDERGILSVPASTNR